MKVIAHLSDLHFGREDALVVQRLADDVRDQRPDVVAVSGDLTQRARRREFEAAMRFIDSLPSPRVVVPGNHDIPLYDAFRRFFFPLHRWHRFITPEAFPVYEDDELRILGLNTARSAAWKEGRISRRQIAEIRRRWGDAAPAAFKVLVTHHPFRPAEPGLHTSIVGRAPIALEALEAAGADLLLSGHRNMGTAGVLPHRHVRVKRSILVAEAGTAMSARRRGEANGYNVITVDPPRLVIQVRVWDGTRFDAGRETTFRKEGDVWLTGGSVPLLPAAQAVSPAASL